MIPTTAQQMSVPPFCVPTAAIIFLKGEAQARHSLNRLIYKSFIIFCKNEQIYWLVSEQEFFEQILQVSIFWGWKDPEDEKSSVFPH